VTEIPYLSVSYPDLTLISRDVFYVDGQWHANRVFSFLARDSI